MRKLKLLLLASLFSTGAAFAGQDSMVEQSPEQVPPESEQMAALEEGEVIYIYPVEVTEYYLIVPSESSEMPG